MKKEAKEKPKWYNARWKASNFFVKIGMKIYPDNPEVKAFIVQQILDQMICGQSITRIDPSKFQE